MKCFICQQAETVAGTTSILLERGPMSLTVTGVPARVCPACGEAYAEEEVAANLLWQAEGIEREGMKVGVRAYEVQD